MLVTRKGRSIKRHSDRMRRKGYAEPFKHAAINYIKDTKTRTTYLLTFTTDGTGAEMGVFAREET